MTDLKHRLKVTLVQRIMDACYDFEDKISLAEAIGCIEIAKFEFMRQQEREDEDG